MAYKSKIALTALLLLILLTLSVINKDYSELLQLLQGGNANEFGDILFSIRLPRAAGAGFAGVLLAAAGCTVQLLFRNPLSSPHVLGSVNTAALGAVGVMALGLHSLTALFLGSCAGALSALLLLWLLPKNRTGTALLLLAGVALNAFAAAAMSGILFAAGERLEGLVFWLLGGFWKLDWASCALLAAAAVVILPLLLYIRREMNMLYLGESAARHAGVDTSEIIFIAVIASAVSVASVVGCCGVIGFVGLLVPHIGRRIFGGDFARHLCGSALLGALLMIGADWAARTLLSPLEIPIGVLTSLIGAPFFMFLILRCSKNGRADL